MQAKPPCKRDILPTYLPSALMVTEATNQGDSDVVVPFAQSRLLLKTMAGVGVFDLVLAVRARERTFTELLESFPQSETTLKRYLRNLVDLDIFGKRMDGTKNKGYFLRSWGASELKFLEDFETRRSASLHAEPEPGKPGAKNSSKKTRQLRVSDISGL